MKQLGFDMLLMDADQKNRDRSWESKSGHLPTDMEEGGILYRDMIAQHHAGMMAGDVEGVMTIRKEARMLARRINNGKIGYLAEGASGRVLETMTKAQDGTIPLWGQTGSFVIDVDGMRVRIELGGIFSLASSVSFWPGFAAHIVEPGKPFFSETGYRSFLGLEADAAPDLAPDAFTAKVIAACIHDQRRSRKRRRV